MYLCTNIGLFKYDSNEDWTLFNEDNSDIPTSNVTGIEFVSDEEYFVSGHQTAIWPYYGGIGHYQNGNFTNYMEDDSPLPHKQVAGILLEENGNLWINCISEGIAIFNPNGIEGFDCIDWSIEIDTSLDLAENDHFTNTFNTYPNPCHDYLNLDLNLSERTVQIFNSQGGLVQQEHLSASLGQSINVSTLSPGYYYISCTSKEGVYNSSFIKE
jgi:hypothetical protein